MMVRAEGRREFVCTAPAESGKPKQRRIGEEVVKSRLCKEELLIYGRDSCIKAMIGK